MRKGFLWKLSGSIEGDTKQNVYVLKMCQEPIEVEHKYSKQGLQSLKLSLKNEVSFEQEREAQSIQIST